MGYAVVEGKAEFIECFVLKMSIDCRGKKKREVVKILTET